MKDGQGEIDKQRETERQIRRDKMNRETNGQTERERPKEEGGETD